MNHKSRLALIQRAINRWLELPRVSRQSISNVVFDEAFKKRVAETLHANGLNFVNPDVADDPSDAMRTNTQALFRWLGYFPEACKPQTQHLFYIEQVILAVMPSQLKTEYLNDVYADSGVYICDAGEYGEYKADGTVLSTSDKADVTRENSEAEISLMRIDSNSSIEEIAAALKELNEAIAKNKQVSAKLERLRHELNASCELQQAKQPEQPIDL